MTQDVGSFIPAATQTPSSGFRIDIHDRLIIKGQAYRLVSASVEYIILRPASGDGLAEQFAMATLARLSAMGNLRHEVGYYLPSDQKLTTGGSNDDFRLHHLTSKQQARFMGRYAQVMAIVELMSEGVIRNNEQDIKSNKQLILDRAVPYLTTTVSERQLLEHDIGRGNLQGVRDKIRRKSRGGNTTISLELYHPSYLVKQVRAYQKEGLSALADGLSKSGNRTSKFRPEELSLMMELIERSYLTLERKTIKATVNDVHRGFRSENQRRVERGLVPFQAPGRDAVRRWIHRIDPLRVKIARYGRQAAIRKLRPDGQGLQVSRPMERVEIDEWRIDLMSILYSGQLHEVLGPNFMQHISLDGKKDRWWIVAAIDCRTKAIVGMKLTRNPTTSAARECLRMTVSDKGQWADAVGALTPWKQAGLPETLVADNGAAFKAKVFTKTCLDLGVDVMRTIAGLPSMRGTIERVFGTASMDLMPRLKGRTFGNVLRKGDYPSAERACLDADDLTFALVRWVVDIYHNSPHAGLGGRSPIEQWDADMADGNYPLRALPDKRSKRLAFGIELTRTVSKSGVTLMGIRYHSDDLAAWFRCYGSRKVDVRWDGADLGAIEVFLEGAWREVAAVHDRFQGLNAQVWLRTRRTLRSKSASRKLWDETVVFEAIDAIEAMVAQKSAAFGILDTSISEEEFLQLERSLFSSFETSATSSKRVNDGEPGQIISPRAPDTDPAVVERGYHDASVARESDHVEMPKQAVDDGNRPKGKKGKGLSHTANLWVPQQLEGDS